MKKLNKFFAVLVALAMMATLCVMSAFAAEGDVPVAKTAYLTKYLELGKDVNVPNATFTFNIIPQSDSANAGTTDMPQGGTTTIAASAMTASASTADEGALKKEVDILAFLGGIDAFTHAGEYVYAVTENQSGLTEDSDPNTTEAMTYDNGAYLIHIYVKNGEDGLEVDNITAETATATTTGEGAEAVTTYTGTGDKVNSDVTDPTEDPSDDNDDEDVDQDEKTKTGKNGVDLYGVVFDNSYTKTVKDVVTPDPDDPTQGSYGALGITKTVTGDYGDKTAEFPFTITLTKPKNWTGTAVTANIYTGTTKGADISIDYNEPYSFKLTDGQALVFAELPAGTSYSVDELLDKTTGEGAAATYDVVNHDKYTASYSWIDDDTAAAKTATKGAHLALESAGLIDDDDAKNAAYYTNAFDDTSVTPTGILINNLPYIVLALVAVGGLCAYVIVRRKNEENA